MPDAIQTGAAQERARHQPPAATFVKHDYDELSVDLGEVVMNYAMAGSPANPALVLLPGQTESWWGYEKAMALLAKDFQVFALDLRGQGRSTRTPGRYTIDNMANDVVRFLWLVVKRPAIVGGCSSGGVITAWLSAFAPPGLLRGAYYEDPPLFASELVPACGPGVRQSIVGPIFERMRIHLGDQWRVGDWAGFSGGGEPPQNLKEYDPEWARAFWEGTVAQACNHQEMLKRVKTPVLMTHHARHVDPDSGVLIGAITDQQAMRVKALVEAAGAPFDYVSLPDAAHAMHASEPGRYAEVLTGWAKRLPA